MDWKDIAGPLIKAGAPAIGTLLGGPLGGTLGGLLGNTVASALGVDATPEAVSSAIATGDPAATQAVLSAADQKVVAEYGYLTELAKAQASVAEKQVESVNNAIIAEAQARAAAPDQWWGQWRTIMAYELTVECPAWAALLAWCILAGKLNELISATSLLTVWWGLRFGVLGVHVWTGSNERQAAITGRAPGGVFGSIAAAITNRKK